ncbi:MAG: hypothetical protein LRS49_04490 [Desulfurococcales archaeon]|nr:hypothetical protein [Desulfurococcales archaeon]
MLVVIEAGPEKRRPARWLAELAERLGFKVVLREVPRGFRVLSPAGVYSDPDQATAALAALARANGGRARR